MSYDLKIPWLFNFSIYFILPISNTDRFFSVMANGSSPRCSEQHRPRKGKQFSPQ